MTDLKCFNKLFNISFCIWIYIIIKCVNGIEFREAVTKDDLVPDEFDKLYITDVTGPIVECIFTAEKQEHSILIEVKTEWAPLGAKRFLDLVEYGFFSDVGLFRVLKDFIVQFGISPLKESNQYWRQQGNIQDDPKTPSLANEKNHIPFKRGWMSYAGGGKNSRTTQMFFTFKDNEWLGRGAQWEVPFARVVNGMRNLDKIYSKYGEKVSQGKISNQGNEYLQAEFPELDYIKGCKVIPMLDMTKSTTIEHEDIEIPLDLFKVEKDQVSEPVVNLRTKNSVEDDSNALTGYALNVAGIYVFYKFAFWLKNGKIGKLT